MTTGQWHACKDFYNLWCKLPKVKPTRVEKCEVKMPKHADDHFDKVMGEIQGAVYGTMKGAYQAFTKATRACDIINALMDCVEKVASIGREFLLSPVTLPVFVTSVAIIIIRVIDKMIHWFVRTFGPQATKETMYCAEKPEGCGDKLYYVTKVLVAVLKIAGLTLAVGGLIDMLKEMATEQELRGCEIEDIPEYWSKAPKEEFEGYSDVCSTSDTDVDCLQIEGEMQAGTIYFPTAAMVSVILGYACMGKSDVPVSAANRVKEFINNMLKVYAATGVITSLGVWMYKICPAAVQEWVSVIVGSPPGATMDDPNVKQWFETAGGVRQAYATDPDCVYTDRRRDVIFLWETMHDVGSILMARKASNLEVKEYHELAKLITLLMRLIWANEGASPTRQVPTCVYIWGPSQVGKSFLTKTLCKDVLGSEGDVAYTRTSSDSFWSGYTKQPAIVFDDFGQTTGNEEAATLIDLISPNLYRPPMAGLEDTSSGSAKGVICTSKLVVLNSNIDPSTAYDKITHQAALRNRFHVCVQTRVRAEYIEGGGVNFNKVTARATPTNPVPHLLFMVVNPHDGKAWRDEAGAEVHMTYAELIGMIKLKMRAHELEYKQTLSTLNETKSDQENEVRLLSMRETAIIQKKAKLLCCINAGLIKPFITVGTICDAIAGAPLREIDALLNQFNSPAWSEYPKFYESLWDFSYNMQKTHMLHKDLRLALVEDAKPGALDAIKAAPALVRGSVHSKTEPDRVCVPSARICESFGVVYKKGEYVPDMAHLANLYGLSFKPTQKFCKSTPAIKCDFQIMPGHMQVRQFPNRKPQPRVAPNVTLANDKERYDTGLMKAMEELRLGVDEVEIPEVRGRVQGITSGVDECSDSESEIIVLKKHSGYGSTREWAQQRMGYMKQYQKRLSQYMVDWWLNLPKWAQRALRYIAMAATIAAAVFAAYTLYKRIFPDSPLSEAIMVGEVQRQHGLEKQKLINIISVVTKDVNERLGTMDITELRKVAILRLQEANIDVTENMPLSVFVENAGEKPDAAQALYAQLYSALKSCPEEVKDRLPLTVAEVTTASDVSTLKTVRQQLKKAFNLMTDVDVSESEAILSQSPRISYMMYQLDKGDIADVLPEGFGQLVEGEVQSPEIKKHKSAANKRWAATHKRAVIHKTKQAVRNRRIWKGKTHVGKAVTCATPSIELDTDSGRLYALPLKQRYIVFPRHLMKMLKNGDRFDVKYKGVTFRDTYQSSRAHCAFFPKSGNLSELTVYCLGDHVPMFKDCMKHYPTLDELDEIESIDGVMIKTARETKVVDNVTVPACSGVVQNQRSTGFASRWATMVVDKPDFYQAGDCGSPVYFESEYGQKTLSMHVFWTPERNMAMSVCLCKEELEMGIKTLSKFSGQVQVAYEGKGVSQYGNFELMDKEFVDKDEKRHTYYKESPLNDGTTNLRPGPMVSSDVNIIEANRPEEERGHSIILAGIMRFSNKNPPYPLELREKARELQLQEYLLAGYHNQPRELTWDEAINGIPGLGPMDMSTSPGYPFVKMGYQKKRDLFIWNEQEQCYEMGEFLRGEVLDAYAKTLQGVVPSLYWSDSLKDELRPLDKVQAGKTRTIVGCSVVATLLIRKFLGHFTAFRNTMYDRSSSAVGMKPFSPDWNDMISYLSKVSSVGFDSDWKRYDGDVGSEEWVDDMRVCQEWYKAQGVTSATFHLGLEVSYYLMTHRLTYGAKTEYILHSGMGSGCPLTATMNTAANDRRMRMYWCHITPKCKWSLTKQMKEIAAKFLGDDGIYASALTNFNALDYANWHKQFGRKMSPAKKDEGLTKALLPITDLSFISLTTQVTNHVLGGQFRACPELRARDKLFNWVSATNLMTKDQNACLRMTAWMWMNTWMSEQQYTQELVRVANLVRQRIPHAQYCLDLPEYGNLQHAYLSGTIELWDEPECPEGTMSVGRVPRMALVEQPVVVNPKADNIRRALGGQKLCKGSVQADKGEETAGVFTPVPLETTAEPVTETSGVKMATTEKPVLQGPKTTAIPRGINDRGVDMNTIVSRWAKITTKTWGTHEGTNLVLWDAVLPWDLLIRNTIRTPFEKMRMGKFDVEIRVETTATKFHSGRLILYWTPLSTVGKAIELNGNNKAAQSFLHNVMIDPSQTGPVELRIPFVHAKDCLNFEESEDSEEHMGSVVLSVFTPLRIAKDSDPQHICNTADVAVTIYARIVNGHFSFPTGSSPIPGLVQGAASTKINKIFVTGNNNVIPTEMQGDEYDQQADLETSMDNPSLSTTPLVIARKGVPGFSHSEGVEFVDKLTLHPNQISVTKISHFRDDKDMMSIANLLEKPVYCDTCVWESCTATSHMLTHGLISPTDCIEGNTPLSIKLMPMIEFISKDFTLWSGSLKYKIDVVASNMHTGTLVFTVHYGRTTPPSDMDDAMAEYAVTMMLTDQQHTFDVTIPYQSDIPQKYVTSGRTTDHESYTGCWALWVQNALRCPGSSFPQVDINIYKSAGEDFKLTYLGMNGCGFQGLTHGDIDMGLAPPKQVVESYDERYSSLRDIARRYTRVTKWNVPTGGADQIILVRQLIKHICAPWMNIYGAWRGDVRVRLVFDPQVTIKTYYVPHHASRLMKPTAAMKMLQGENYAVPIAMAAGVGAVQYMDIEIPFVTPYNFMVNDDFSSYNEMGSLILDARNSGAVATVDIFVSGGDSFRLGVPRTIPLVHWMSKFDPIGQVGLKDKVTVVPSTIVMDYPIASGIVNAVGYDSLTFIQGTIEHVHENTATNPAFSVNRCRINTKDLTLQQMIDIGVVPNSVGATDAIEYSEDVWHIVAQVTDSPHKVFAPGGKQPLAIPGKYTFVFETGRVTASRADMIAHGATMEENMGTSTDDFKYVVESVDFTTSPTEDGAMNYIVTRLLSPSHKTLVGAVIWDPSKELTVSVTTKLVPGKPEFGYWNETQGEESYVDFGEYTAAGANDLRRFQQ